MTIEEEESKPLLGEKKPAPSLDDPNMLETIFRHLEKSDRASVATVSKKWHYCSKQNYPMSLPKKHALVKAQFNNVPFPLSLKFADTGFVRVIGAIQAPQANRLLYIKHNPDYDPNHSESNTSSFILLKQITDADCLRQFDELVHIDELDFRQERKLSVNELTAIQPILDHPILEAHGGLTRKLLPEYTKTKNSFWLYPRVDALLSHEGKWGLAMLTTGAFSISLLLATGICLWLTISPPAQAHYPNGDDVPASDETKSIALLATLALSSLCAFSSVFCSASFFATREHAYKKERLKYLKKVIEKNLDEDLLDTRFGFKK